MKKSILYLTLMAVIIIYITASCAKEGPIGPQGIQGEKGNPGSVNIKTYNITFSNSDWYFLGTLGNSDARWVADFYNSEITNDVFNNGTVLMYYKSSSGHWVSLPQTFYSGTFSYTLTYGYNNGSVFLARYDSDLNPINPGYLESKIVIIPGSGKKYWDVDYNDYEAVKKYFNIKD